MGIRILRLCFGAVCVLLFLAGFTPQGVDSCSLVQPAKASPQQKVLHLAQAKRLDLDAFTLISPTIKMRVRGDAYRSPYTAVEEAYLRHLDAGELRSPSDFVLIRLDETFLGQELTIECPVRDFARWQWKRGYITCGGVGNTVHFKFERLSMVKNEGFTWIYASADGESFLKLKGCLVLQKNGVMNVVPTAVRVPE